MYPQLRVEGLGFGTIINRTNMETMGIIGIIYGFYRGYRVHIGVIWAPD